MGVVGTRSSSTGSALGHSDRSRKVVMVQDKLYTPLEHHFLYTVFFFPAQITALSVMKARGDDGGDDLYFIIGKAPINDWLVKLSCVRSIRYLDSE